MKKIFYLFVLFVLVAVVLFSLVYNKKKNLRNDDKFQDQKKDEIITSQEEEKVAEKDEEPIVCSNEILYDNILEKEKYVVKNNCVYWEGKILTGVDFSTFQDLGYRYAIDSKNVFHWGRIREYIDRDSFKVFNDFAVDKNRVYYYAEEIFGADSASFEAVGNAYGKDRREVYYGARAIRGADVNSFKYLSGDYGIDRNFIYAQEKRLQEFDVKTFVVIDQYYAKDKNNMYCLDKKIQNADIESFQIIQDFFAKDKNQIYHMGDPIVLYPYGEAKGKADVATFKVIQGHYSEDRDHIFLRDMPLGHVSLENDPYVPLPKSIKVINGQHNCAEYKTQLYCYGYRIEEIDPKTFQFLKEEYRDSLYVRDKNGIYFLENIGEKIAKKESLRLDADKESFEIIDYSYARDRNNLFLKGRKSKYSIVGDFKFKNFYFWDRKSLGYLRVDEEGGDIVQVIPGADPDSFVIINNYYAKDKKYVYFDGKIIEGAKAESFRVLPNVNIKYARDDDHIYLYGQVFDVDAATFKYIDDNHSKDKDFVYIFDKKMENSDPKTFEILGDSEYSKDKNNVYFHESVVVGADPKSFKITGRRSGKDSAHKYEDGLVTD